MGRLGTHPNIVTVFDLGTEDGSPYIVTELMGGGDVEGLLEESDENRFPLHRTIEIGKAVCDGLEFAHGRGIIHRDLKPGNVWLTDDGTAKIGDFGFAMMTDRSRLTREAMMVAPCPTCRQNRPPAGRSLQRQICTRLGPCSTRW
jgi:serine/threonine protein kinase